jgi:hypothetical protein
MKFHELKTIWQEQEGATWPEPQRILFEESSIREVRKKLWEVRWENYFELLFAGPFLLFLIGFAIDHFSNRFLFVPALILMIGTLAGGVFNIRQLYLYYRISPQNGIIGNQRLVERIRYNQLMEINALLVIIPLFSLPFLILGAQLILNFDLRELDIPLIHFFFGSVVVAAILVFLMRRFPNKALEESARFLEELEEWDTV